MSDELKIDKNITTNGKDVNETRTPSIFLHDLNKLRKIREFRKYELMKQRKFLPIMYGSENQ